MPTWQVAQDFARACQLGERVTARLLAHIFFKGLLLRHDWRGNASPALWTTTDFLDLLQVPPLTKIRRQLFLLDGFTPCPTVQCPGRR